MKIKGIPIVSAKISEALTSDTPKVHYPTTTMPSGSSVPNLFKN